MGAADAYTQIVDAVKGVLGAENQIPAFSDVAEVDAAAADVWKVEPDEGSPDPDESTKDGDRFRQGFRVVVLLRIGATVESDVTATRALPVQGRLVAALRGLPIVDEVGVAWAASEDHPGRWFALTVTATASFAP